MREAIVDEAYDHSENPESLTFSGVGMGTSGEKACLIIICATTEGMCVLKHETHKGQEIRLPMSRLLGK